ncbi:MAG: exodeoxyribonuclease III [Leptospiraceae bacterium]|nr:exodeoxyribonuclease III [Leptospiraceae bacterium]
MRWNVNGIRADLKKGFLDFLRAENPDVLCLQETRGQPENDILERELPEYEIIWNLAQKKGYSGTALFLKKGLSYDRVQRGLKQSAPDEEGRVLYVEFPDFYLLTVYTPNSGEELKRLDYRMQWDKDFKALLNRLNKKKPVIFCGDLNVAHQEIDIARPDANRKNAGFTDEERRGFSNILAAGFVDTFREFNTEPGQYTWWSYRFNARAKNIGWRLDYFCVSRSLRARLKNAFILSDVTGSDHCPVGIELQ